MADFLWALAMLPCDGMMVGVVFLFLGGMMVVVERAQHSLRG